VSRAPDERSPTAVTVRAGERFTIRLDANATTGYRWRIATAPDPTVARVLGSEYEPGDPATAGSGGTDVWRLEAVGAGESQLVLEYVRPWERDRPAIRTHTVRVRVQP
jgi:inhibitor of cysteine peptidase